MKSEKTPTVRKSKKKPIVTEDDEDDEESVPVERGRGARGDVEAVS